MFWLTFRVGQNDLFHYFFIIFEGYSLSPLFLPFFTPRGCPMGVVIALRPWIPFISVVDRGYGARVKADSIFPRNFDFTRWGVKKSIFGHFYPPRECFLGVVFDSRPWIPSFSVVELGFGVRGKADSIFPKYFKMNKLEIGKKGHKCHFSAFGGSITPP